MKRVFITLSIATAIMVSGCKEESAATTTPAVKSENADAPVKTETVVTTDASEKSDAAVKKDVVGELPTLDNPLESEKERFSFVVGYNMGTQLKAIDAEIDREVLVASLIEAMDGKEPRLTIDEAKLVQQKVYGRLQEQEMARQRENLEKGKARVEEGKKFLTHNKTQPGVTTTESGLQYKVITKGSGPKPSATDRVKVHYVGTLIDGTEFDSSVKRGIPAEFPVSGVIKGWIEGLQLMPVGSKYKFFIPAELAYGKNPPRGSAITPDEMLTFEVELLSIIESEKKEEPKK